MAISSIFRDIHITDKKHAKAFIDALEISKNAKCKEISSSMKIKQLDRSEIKNFFDKKC
ncbi:MAG: hypothetical protein ACYCYI_00315 [Saccharofermentanales bacterium]